MGRHASANEPEMFVLELDRPQCEPHARMQMRRIPAGASTLTGE